MSDWIDVANASELAPGEYRIIDIDDVMVAVFNIDGEFYAIEDSCTHDHLCLTGGEIEGEEITCPHHGARFNIKTGEALSAPAYEATSTFPVRVVDGIIQVRDDRWD